MMVKKNVIENRKADEVMQFQSLMLVLMHMSGMTTEWEYWSGWSALILFPAKTSRNVASTYGKVNNML